MQDIIFRIILLSVIVTFCLCNKLCDDKYNKLTSNHSMCKPPNQGCRFGRKGKNYYPDPLLRTHNNIRNGIKRFVGKDYKFGTNLLIMEWDDELYEIARSHALQCVEVPDCDLCHQTDRFHVEQNFAVKTFTTPELKNAGGPVRRFQTVIKEWASELKLYDPNIVQNFKFQENLPTNWTNLFRANTTKVGCASMHYKTDVLGVFMEVYVCNYGPANLLENEKIFEPGKPCSNCPENMDCDFKYKRLCGGVVKVETEIFVEPITEPVPSFTSVNERRRKLKDIFSRFITD